MIKIVQGNLLEADENIIGHQVNCIGVMAAGLARQIRNKYPVVFEEYKEIVDSYVDKSKLLGKHQLIPVGDNKYVSNLFGQQNIGRHERQTDYMALCISLNNLSSIAKSLNLSVALPYGLGCGLAGGNWDDVYELIEDAFLDYDVTIYKFY